MTYKYGKCRDVKSPIRGTGQLVDRSAGLDFFVPKWSPEFEVRLRELNGDSIFDEWADHMAPKDGRLVIGVQPHSHVLIPSGIVMNLQPGDHHLIDINNGIAFIAFNKSKIGGRQLDVAATVVDEDYQGEIHISLTNTSDERRRIDFDEKIVQFILVPILLPQFEESLIGDLFDRSSIRGSKGFGSTGSK